jgi:L-rhamnose mutarotase
MPVLAFFMQLHACKQVKHKARHNATLPELSVPLKGFGIIVYRIFFKQKHRQPAGRATIEDACIMDAPPQHPVMQKWWAYMANIMETNPDNTPASIPLREVFHLP